MTTLLERTDRREFTADELRRMRQLGMLGPDEDRPGRLTADEYYRLADEGILGWDERIELLDGEIVVMPPISPQHASPVKWFVHAFAPLLVEDRILLGVQDPVRLDEGNELEPDLSVCRHSLYADAHPQPDDILLVVEVANTSLRHDKRHKVPAYARAGIPELWLADINARLVEVYTEPVDGVYRVLRKVDIEGVLTPTAFPDLRIPVRDIYQ